MEITFDEKIVKKIADQAFQYCGSDLAALMEGGRIPSANAIETTIQALSDIGTDSSYTSEEKIQADLFCFAGTYDELVAWMKENVFPNKEY